MRAKLYEKLKNKKNLLKNLIEIPAIDKKTKDEIESSWEDYSPKHRQDFSVVVSDGSFRIKQYLGFYLIVFGGYGYFHNLSTKENDEWDAGDIILSVGKRSEVIKSYASLLMFLSELKSMYKIAKEKKPDIIIFDGTITSRLITPFPRTDWFIKSNDMEEEINKICTKVINSLKNGFLDATDIFSLSEEVENRVIETLSKSENNINLRQDTKEAVISKLAYYEMMATMADLFKNCDSSLIIGVAKTSSGTDIFKEFIPDIKIFSRYTNTLGHSKKSIQQNITELKSSFGKILGDISTFLSEMNIQAFYAKYSSQKVVNLIEFYQNPNTTSVNIQDILDMLSSISVDGYPFLLKKVDNEVSITNKDIEFIEKELGLEREITGRENL